MDLAHAAFNQILIMFLIILVGLLCYKVKLIDINTNKRLSDIVLLLVNPIIIFTSYQREFNKTLLKGLLISIVMALATHLFAIILSSILIRSKKMKKNLDIERFAVIYTNCGFIGIPLVNGIPELGSKGVFYLTAYITIFNLLAWTHGVIMMKGKGDAKSTFKALKSPAIVATLVGFLFFIFHITVPEVPLKTLTYLGDMNTPLAMLVSGVTIAQTNLISLFSKIRIYYVSFLRLVFVPVIMLLIFSLFHIDRIIVLTSVLAASCPSAAAVTLFSLRYGKDSVYASELFTVSTICSVVTIPLVMSLAGYFV